MPAKKKEFDVSKYKLTGAAEERRVRIEETGDEFDVKIRQMSWSQRNKLISRCLNLGTEGVTAFDGDLYVRECLKEMIIEAPWGKTSETFLITIDPRLGSALESLVPAAFGEQALPDVSTTKNE